MGDKMQTKEWRFIDKAGWGEGPWQDEPDKVQWQDEATGLPCLIRRNGASGALCGYVGVPEGHPWFGRDYSDLLSIEVHGGLTYSDLCDSDDKEHGICHVAEDGIKRWWLGFDANHGGDVAPGMEARSPFARMAGSFYRNIEYMKAQCADLARQVSTGEPDGR
jgi:hypothetical protein